MVDDCHLDHSIVVDQDQEVSIQSRMRGSSIYCFMMNFSENTKNKTSMKSVFSIEINMKLEFIRTMS